MRKLYLPLIFGILLCLDSMAQLPQPALSRDYSERAQIDDINLRVTYSCRTRRVLHVEDYSSDIQVLEIGNKYCRYYSKYAELKDSLYLVSHNSVNLGKDSEGNMIEPTYEDVYWDYPGKGDMSVYTRFVRKTFEYTEEIPEIVWTLTPYTDTILGYSCVEAKAEFRGRNWTVWFASDIPVNYGPWKLSGLPGLILKAEDDDKFFTFEAIEIASEPSQSMMKYTERAQKCKRENVMELNDLRWKDSTFLIQITGNSEVLTFDPYGYSQITPQTEVVIPQKELN